MYNSFAYVYDEFMENVPYERWAKMLADILRGDGIEDGLLLDLGCGTGTLTRLMADLGYDMTGVDLSADMLSSPSSFFNVLTSSSADTSRSAHEFSSFPINPNAANR